MLDKFRPASPPKNVLRGTFRNVPRRRPSGAILAVYNAGTSSLVKGTIPLPGGETAIYNSTGLNYIRHTDWLGSSRFSTTWGHAVYAKESYAPFGETYGETTQTDRSFTGQDQDVINGSGGTGVYDFLYRKQDPSAGRWLSPDPAGWSAVDLTNPQSLNRYGYVLNSPLSLVDPLGLYPYLVCYNITSFYNFNHGGAQYGSELDLYVECFSYGSDSGGGPSNAGNNPGGNGNGSQTGGGGGGGGSPSNGTCTAQRILSGLMGAANLGLAIYKAPELGAAVLGLSATGAGAPAAAVLAVYGTTSIFGQGLSGAAQLYSAATGNYGTPAQVAQLGSILSGPVSGLGTLVAGGSMASAERNAGYESMFTAGSGFVQALSSMNGVSAIVNNLDGFITHIGMQPGASGGCGSGH